MKEHKVSICLSKLKIQECCTEQEIIDVYPVLQQLRNQLDIDTFLERVRRSKLEGYRLFYACIDKQVIGAVGLRFLNDLCWGYNLYVDDLIVDQNFHECGIGKALMKFVEDLARSQKCYYVRLASGISRTNVHGFYEYLGYRKTSFAFALKL